MSAGIIYAIRWDRENWLYIGGSGGTAKQRKGNHRRQLRDGTHPAKLLQLVYDEHCKSKGGLGLDFGILEYVQPNDDWQEREDYWIEKVPCIFNARKSRWRREILMEKKNAPDIVIPLDGWSPLFSNRCYAIVTPSGAAFLATSLNAFLRAHKLSAHQRTFSDAVLGKCDIVGWKVWETSPELAITVPRRSRWRPLQSDEHIPEPPQV